MKGRRKILLIGWDAADWKIINPLIKMGKMPALKGLIDSGVSGNISTLEPPLSPMLWTSIATGMYADKHGILGFTEPDPNTAAIRPVSSTSRKVRAIWNILSHQGYKTNVLAWWPSHPAEPVNGICVSNLYQRAHQPISEPWPMAPGMVHPADLSPVFKELRIHPDELTEAHILPFLPDAEKIDQDKDNRLAMLSRILADCASVHSAATWAMENSEWDFTAVYLDAIDHFSHGFMKFHPPQMPGLPDDLFQIYRNVISVAYEFHDMMLDRLLKLAGEDTTVILLSDHGFKSDHLRLYSVPKEPAGPAYEHRQFGILVMRGEGIKQNEKIYGSSLLDITPTILTLLGLPVGKDMDGIPLSQAFSRAFEISEIDSWESVEGDFGMHDEAFIEDPFLAKQALDQLIELGYIEKQGSDEKKSALISETESQYNLARVYMGSSRSHLAIPILEKLHESTGEERFSLRLVICYKNLGELEKCEELISVIRRSVKKDQPSLDVLEASILIDLKREKEALALLEKTQKKALLYPDLYIQAGRCYLSLQEWDKAEQAFIRVLALDPDKAVAHHGIGLSLLRKGKYEEAVEALLNGIGLVYQFPTAHFHLGECLYQLGESGQALQCFEVALAINPAMTMASEWIERIRSEYPGIKSDRKERKQGRSEDLTVETRPSIPKKNFKSFAGKTRGEILIVSGLPRSGTSMMMQMLELGGLEPFTDKKRKADDSNPKGYYEHEAIKATARDQRWLIRANGKTAKVICQLLVLLPPSFKYRIIFMHRDLSEIIRSQHKMMVANGKAKKEEYPAGMEMAFRKSLEKSIQWARQSFNAELLELNYTDVIENPEVSAAKIADFLGKDLHVSRMASVVDKSLYRNKVKTTQ